MGCRKTEKSIKGHIGNGEWVFLKIIWRRGLSGAAARTGNFNKINIEKDKELRIVLNRRIFKTKNEQRKNGIMTNVEIKRYTKKQEYPYIQVTVHIGNSNICVIKK